MSDTEQNEREAIRQRARALAESRIAPRAAKADETEAYPWENVRDLTEAGFMGMTIPRTYGGQGRGLGDVLVVIEEMAKVCGVTGRIVVEANMGGVGAIMAYGSEAQKQLAADLVLKGDKPAICITEPGAGSAATEMTTTARRVGDRYVINGRKHWITGGGVSRLHLVFARVLDPADRDLGIAGFIALRDETEGLKIGARERTMGLRAIPETEIFFDNMTVPVSAMVVPPRGLAHGFGDLMNAYNAQRVGAGTVALGLAQGAYEAALAYTQSREQFGRPICEFQGLQWMLADMSIQLAAARALLERAADVAPGEFPDPMAAAQAKIFAAEMAIKVTNDALQMFGAAGYSRSNPVERMLRDARMFTIGGGTAQVLRNVVASHVLGRRLPQTRDGYSAPAQVSPPPVKASDAA